MTKQFRFVGFSHKTWEPGCRNLGMVWASSIDEARQAFKENGLAPPVIKRKLGDASYRLVDDNGNVTKEMIFR
jgi:hypothetical protein